MLLGNVSNSTFHIFAENYAQKILRGHLDLYLESDKHDRIFNFELHIGRTGISKCRQWKHELEVCSLFYL